MSDAILYLDTSDVREGALDELKPAIKRLVAFVEANEPRLIAYNVYLSEDGTRMTVVSMHPDSASLEYHMEVARPLFREFVDLVTLSSIHIYGEPSEKVLRQSHEKAQLLGRGIDAGRRAAPSPRYIRPEKSATAPTTSISTSVSWDASPSSSPRTSSSTFEKIPFRL
jgi:quinol monooxygenase YgiN